MRLLRLICCLVLSLACGTKNTSSSLNTNSSSTQQACGLASPVTSVTVGARTFKPAHTDHTCKSLSLQVSDSTCVDCSLFNSLGSQCIFPPALLPQAEQNCQYASILSPLSTSLTCSAGNVLTKLGGTYYCLPCTMHGNNCSTCTIDTCTGCSAGFYLDAQNKCQSCGTANCSTCSAATPQLCTTCNSGFYFDTVNLTCNPCPSNCTACTNGQKCTSIKGCAKMNTGGTACKLCDSEHGFALNPASSRWAQPTVNTSQCVTCSDTDNAKIYLPLCQAKYTPYPSNTYSYVCNSANPIITQICPIDPNYRQYSPSSFGQCYAPELLEVGPKEKWLWKCALGQGYGGTSNGFYLQQ